MFRRMAKGLPPDASYPADLTKLGYFLNENGQIRMMAYPDKDFQFHFSNQERHNEVHREAMQTCQRQLVLERLSALGINELYLPGLTSTKPNGPHIPILAPPADILKTRKRVIVLVNDDCQDLGVLAYRRLQRELGVSGGSIVNFIKEVIHRSLAPNDASNLFHDAVGVEDKARETPGFIIMNCGQLYYSPKYNRAMSLKSWSAKPRKSVYHEMDRIHPVENYLEGNCTPQEHIRYVFDNVIKNKDFVAENAEVYVIAIENGVEKLLDVLGANFERYGSRITAMSIMNSLMVRSQISNSTLKAFLEQRARQWVVSASGSNNPRDCLDVPGRSGHEVEAFDSSKASDTTSMSQMQGGLDFVDWLENVSSSDPGLDLCALLNRLTLTVDQGEPDRLLSATVSIWDQLDSICPTFSDAENPSGAGECVFTDKAVQHCVLDFFEEVTQDPHEFRNPKFKVTASEPSYNDTSFENTALGEVVEVGELQDDSFQPLLPSEMMPEHAELDTMKADLEVLQSSLYAIPANKPELEPGRQTLAKRIEKCEAIVEEKTRKLLGKGGLKAGEAQSARDQWKPVLGGPKIMMGGAMVDSELVRGAGLLDTAEEGLANLDAIVEELGGETDIKELTGRDTVKEERESGLETQE